MTDRRPWPWLPNYVYAHPDDAPYTLDEVLPAFEPGWQPLVREAFDFAAAQGAIVTQVKQKWGLLRVYMSGFADYDAYVALYEDLMTRSARICEVCGDEAATPAQMHGGRTLCAPCAAQEASERAAEAADPDRWRARHREAADRFDAVSGRLDA